MGGWRGMGVLATAVVLLAGCGARWPWASEAGETRLEGTKWQWVAGGSGGAPRTIEQPVRYTIEFLSEYRLDVRADCNSAAGPWRTHDSAVMLGPFVVSRKACPAASLGTEFLANLEAARGWSVRDGALFLELPERRGDLRFAPVVAKP